MPPFRNPFGRRPPTNGVVPGDENVNPNVLHGTKPAEGPDLPQTRKSSALSIKPNKMEPDEFKLSVVNDSGVYLPPSPPEKKGFWHRSPTSTSSSSHRSMLSENEPFSISRESFDSYRRSFDISARSPIQHESATSRQSLDSHTRRTPRSAIHGRFERPPPTDEEGFEDVGLNDEAKPKKRGIFARFGDSTDAIPQPEDPPRPGSAHALAHSRFHLPGRKRAHSGQGAELGNLPKKVEGEAQ